jgi:hypothetical protein
VKYLLDSHCVILMKKVRDSLEIRNVFVVVKAELTMIGLALAGRIRISALIGHNCCACLSDDLVTCEFPFREKTVSRVKIAYATCGILHPVLYRELSHLTFTEYMRKFIVKHVGPRELADSGRAHGQPGQAYTQTLMTSVSLKCGVPWDQRANNMPRYVTRNYSLFRQGPLSLLKGFCRNQAISCHHTFSAELTRWSGTTNHERDCMNSLKHSFNPIEKLEPLILAPF